MTGQIIIGIDPGYARCGFGVIGESGQNWEVLGHGVMTTSPGYDHADRLAEIARDFMGLLDRFRADTLVIEELFFAKSTTTALKVAEVCGVILMKAKEAGLRIVEVKPNEVKMALTGYGAADKVQMQQMVKTIFQLSEVPKPDDAADALAIAWTGATKLIS
jgi:crossover junction endodeoxyribonuclease RuvC